MLFLKVNDPLCLFLLFSEVIWLFIIFKALDFSCLLLPRSLSSRFLLLQLSLYLGSTTSGEIWANIHILQLLTVSCFFRDCLIQGGGLQRRSFLIGRCKHWLLRNQITLLAGRPLWITVLIAGLSDFWFLFWPNSGTLNFKGTIELLDMVTRLGHFGFWLMLSNCWNWLLRHQT